MLPICVIICTDVSNKIINSRPIILFNNKRVSWDKIVLFYLWARTKLFCLITREFLGITILFVGENEVILTCNKTKCSSDFVDKIEFCEISFNILAADK